MILSNPKLVQFYINKEEKEQFTQRCFQLDTTMSREIRRFIRDFNRNPPIDDRMYYSSFNEEKEQIKT